MLKSKLIQLTKTLILCEQWLMIVNNLIGKEKSQILGMVIIIIHSGFEVVNTVYIKI